MNRLSVAFRLSCAWIQFVRNATVARTNQKTNLTSRLAPPEEIAKGSAFQFGKAETLENPNLPDVLATCLQFRLDVNETRKSQRASSLEHLPPTRLTVKVDKDRRCRDDRKNSDSLVGSTVLNLSFRRAACLLFVSRAFGVETKKLRRGELNEYKPKQR